MRMFFSAMHDGVIVVFEIALLWANFSREECDFECRFKWTGVLSKNKRKLVGLFVHLRLNFFLPWSKWQEWQPPFATLLK